MEGQELIEKVNWLVYYAQSRELNADEKALVQKRIDRISQEIQFEKNEIRRLERALAEKTPTSSEQLAAPAVSKSVEPVCEDTLKAFFLYIDDKWAMGMLTDKVDEVIDGFKSL